MDINTKKEFREGLKKHPKAKVLAETFLVEALQQGANFGDFKLGTAIALTILGEVVVPDPIFLDLFQGDIENALRNI